MIWSWIAFLFPLIVSGAAGVIVACLYFWRGWLPLSRLTPHPGASEVTRDLAEQALIERCDPDAEPGPGTTFDRMAYLVDVYRCALRMRKGCSQMHLVARGARRIQKRRDCTQIEYIKQKAGL